jgi:hypothetical protein
LAKRQAKMAVNKASKACRFMKQISALDDQVSSLTARFVHHEECESFILGIIESACEMLRCKTLFSTSPFSLDSLISTLFAICLAVVGTCLDFAAEDHRVAE